MVDQTKLMAQVPKILNSERDKLQGTDFNTLLLNVRIAANTFKSVLAKLEFEDGNYESNELQTKEIIKELGDIQSMIKLKILSLRKAKTNEIKIDFSKTKNRQSSTKSLLSCHSKLTRKMSSSSECTGSNLEDPKSEAFSISKLMSLSKESICTTKSSQSDYLGYDDVNDEKFKEFILNVNCPFCLKREDNKESLAEHLDRACTSFKTKNFAQNLVCPYSIFQLLPNNAFKCNICPDSVQSTLKDLKNYFMHSQSAIHVLGYNKAASRKNYTDLIFCASCKIQIPNNATQILFHMQHEVHKRNRKDIRSSHFFRQKGIGCVYSKEKKFKCLTCPPPDSIHKSVEDFLHHVESKGHIGFNLSQKKKSPSTYRVYCMFCLAEVNGVLNVIGHFSSSEHIHKEKEEDNNEFQLCVYCGFKCSKLLELAQHTEVCLDKIGQKDNHPESEEFDKVLGQDEKEQEKPTKENASEKGRCIMVKGYPKILELYHYFKQFGDVLDIEPHGENTVVIKFLEEMTVDQILESEKDIEINGMKLKITRKEDLDCSDVKLESSGTAESRNSFPVANNDGSDLGSTCRDVFGISNLTLEDSSKVAMDSSTLESLFNRVSSHLSYTTLKPDCEEFLSIAADCERILKVGKCQAIGFLKCGLAFPVEKITLYCELSNSFIKEESSDYKSTSLTESILFNENLCDKCVSLFKKADAVSRVKLVKLREESFPLVEFYHNKTQKLCTITFRQSDNILADELRYCLEDNGELRSFVLIIRFWLSVHRLEIREFETVIISLLVFFLLSSGVKKTPSENFSQKRKEILNTYGARIQGSMKCYQNLRKKSIMELFENFLLFLNEFDFEDMAICLPFLSPVPKSKLSQEPLKKYLCKWFYPKAPVWIMDPFLFNNMAVDVKKTEWDSLLKTVRETIEHYHICAKT